VAIARVDSNRIIHVKVVPRADERDLIGSIGHELRHAIEVLGDPTVTNNLAMRQFYMREGRQMGTAFETDAAVRAGERVRAEVGSPAR
jgi:hypothetical protein